MNNIYIILKNNQFKNIEVEDIYFKTYREASQYLINEGYEVFYDELLGIYFLDFNLYLDNKVISNAYIKTLTSNKMSIKIF